MILIISASAVTRTQCARSQIAMGSKFKLSVCVSLQVYDGLAIASPASPVFASPRPRREAHTRSSRGCSTRAAARTRATEASSAAAASRASDAASALNETLNAARERGEKLSELGDKAQQLADDADDFANMAKALRKQQEKGLFGGLF